ncbi:hypothetical protein O4D10_02165 [Xanthomonas citri pv. citri]|uniref:hypothetical protein n=1 Tax=Xanthomonas citri TaxID=346 RepID=UPI0036DCB834
MGWIAFCAVLSIAMIAIAAWWVWAKRLASRAPERQLKQEDSCSLPFASAVELQELTPVEYQWATSEQHPPAVTLRVLGDLAQTVTRRSALDLSSGGASRLAPLLQTLPTVANAATFQSGQFMEVIVSGNLSEAAGGLLYPFARGEGGKISALAKLKDPLVLSGAINGALVFQAVSVIVAQKHLADISRKLTELKNGIDEIKLFLERSRHHSILAIIDVIEKRIATVQAGNLDNQGIEQLNLCDQRLFEIQGHLADDINAALIGLSKVEKSSSWNPFSAADVQRAIEKNITRVEQLSEQWFLATQARLAGWTMLCTYPISQELKEARLASNQKKIDALLVEEQLQSKLAQAIEERIAAIKGIVGNSMWKDSARDKRAKLLVRRAHVLNRMDSHEKLIRLAVKLAKTRAEEREQPLRLAVRYEGSLLIEAFELEPNEHARIATSD